MISLREFKEKNCPGCYYNGWLGRGDAEARKLFCAYSGSLTGMIEDGICLVRAEEKDAYSTKIR